MPKYKEPILDTSIWITATPTAAALSLPFSLTEAGHFFADPHYGVNRQEHDSFLFLYTISGCGMINSGDSQFRLPQRHAALIDCHRPHSYHSQETAWEFIWLHIRGTAPENFYHILFPDEPASIPITDTDSMARKTTDILIQAKEHDILHSAELSGQLHELFNLLLKCSVQKEQGKHNGRYSGYLYDAAKMIQNQYDKQLTIDDMVQNIPISKYHFIRLFKRLMGTSPYHYLTDQRINAAKTYLTTTDLSVNEIALKCGFTDTSNFIVQFKKHTGQKPLSYRQYFIGTD